ncbi:MAG TPA: hypothetical protein VFV95_02545 [Vicinamibacterales bacterium]|nr:hypothetical protein [Vicinamibacterales bacterium]
MKTRLCASHFGEAGATDERVQAVVDFGFTERQARFLVLVMRHAGVCVPRQYARFAGVAYGAKCNAFFDKLVRRGFAVANHCIHNRARLYHVHHKPLYHVIGEVTSRYRRRVPARLAVQRLMLLDAVLTTPELEWLTTASEKNGYLARLRKSAVAEPPGETPTAAQSRPTSELVGTFPIGLERDGRAVLSTRRRTPGRMTSGASCSATRPCSESRRRGRCGWRFRSHSTVSTMPIRRSFAKNWNHRFIPRRSLSPSGTSRIGARRARASIR